MGLWVTGSLSCLEGQLPRTVVISNRRIVDFLTYGAGRLAQCSCRWMKTASGGDLPRLVPAAQAPYSRIEGY